MISSVFPSVSIIDIAAYPSPIVFVFTTIISLSVYNLAACSAVKMTFPLFGKTKILSALTLSKASIRSFADGFMLCPPSTISSVPRDKNVSFIPFPAATATIPVFFLFFFACRLRAEFSASLAWALSPFSTASLCCKVMFSIFKVRNSPNF